MPNPTGAPRRVRVDRNIYKRPSGVFEVGYRDSTGRQRWQTVDGGIMAARAVRDDLLGRKGRGEKVQPNPKLRFGEAADKWLADQVSELRPATQAIYRNAIDTHLAKRWGNRRLDTITVDDVAGLIRELRAEGKSEWTISGVLKAAGRVFKFARRRMAWNGQNPVEDLETSERPKVASTQRRRVYQGDELRQTLAAATGIWKVLFSLAAVTGARLSELLALTWADVDLADLSAASVSIEWQVDRRGRRQPLKTTESRRVVELPPSMAALVARHKLAAPGSLPGGLGFATRSGLPLEQRNVMRALRATQTRAVDDFGRPTFPSLHERTTNGRRVVAARGSVPSFHSFRHTAVSEALSDGESADEIAWQLGHKNAIVTRTVYAQEIKSVERRARRRAALESRYGSTLPIDEPRQVQGG